MIVEDETITKEELVECKALIEKEKTKIKYLRKSMIEEEISDIKEHKNKIILVPTIGGNIRVIDELEHIPNEYYDFEFTNLNHPTCSTGHLSRSYFFLNVYDLKVGVRKRCR